MKRLTTDQEDLLLIPERKANNLKRIWNKDMVPALHSRDIYRAKNSYKKDVQPSK